ncbi:hypothetical protein M406DRAFT_353289 [Cryphonectria parasitica EP155]|uniref:Copper-fist domain-containing protein n=1 Tax=Cryphonectria parasitica (strain ATCC 38755 / EP155) TaxID=660469 RepID=A0A9P4XW07_CRYP1|nr:uncharacterized protein M406DRAFT_353289 [Cryphonectria parasitica EP155]KAF3761847.1 hypothetical protein M406DRAFT_353289 [Cryphonectria parasitica EP155]
MAIWVGKQKMSCRSCIKGHRSSTCNHIGGPLWAVRPAGRPNKACIHGPGDLCLCAHYFPLTWLKAAVPRKQKCSCSGSSGAHSGSGGSSSNGGGSSNSSKKCPCCSNGNGAGAATPEDETQPIFYQDLVSRGLQVTSEPVEYGLPPSQPPTTASCCSSRPAEAPLPAPIQMPVSGPPATAARSSCCSGPAEMETAASNPPPPPPSLTATTNGYRAHGHVKTESVSAPPFTPIQQFHTSTTTPPPTDFPVMKFSPLSPGGAGDHVCECGPTCNCVLCIDHPYNTATMHHIATEFGQMMSSGAPFSPVTTPAVSHHAGGFGRPEFYPPGWPPNHNGSGMMTSGLVADPSAMMSRHNSNAQPYSPPQQATDMDIILNPADFEMINFAFPPMEDGEQYHHQHQHQQQQFDQTMGVGLDPMTTDDLMDINGFCGGAPEGCPCGDDCACIGCLIHKPTTVDAATENGMGLGLGLGNGHVAGAGGLGSPGWHSAL